MAEARHTPVIHVVGPPGSGKTTLCRLFLNAFPDKSVLAVDASDDAYLSLSYGISSPVSVETLVRHMQVSPLSRETIDWALQDLPIAVETDHHDGEVELLVWGHVPTELSPLEVELLSYGLPRLFAHYDVVIWDGDLDAGAVFLDPNDIRHLIVITPDDEAYCQQVTYERAMVLLSKARAIDILPPTAAHQIQRGNWKFLGKLPPLSPPEKRIKELPQYIQDCFHKLDLPIELRPRLA